MSFPARVLSLCVAIFVLAALLLLGIFLSPERVQARTEGRPLLPQASVRRIDGIEIRFKGEPQVTLRKLASGWEAPDGGNAYPASVERITTFLRTVAGLTRGRPVTSDAAHLAELGLDWDSAHVLVLRQAGTKPDLELHVGKRGPSGDEDYVMVDGEKAVTLVRGPLAFYMAQDRASWFELHVLPDDVLGETIATISVTGGLAIPGSAAGELRGPYTLVRGSDNPAGTWTLRDEKSPVNGGAAAGMANALAMLEGTGFAGPSRTGAGAGPRDAGAGRLLIDVTTRGGKKYSLSVFAGEEQGTVLVTTSWSPWTYVVNELPFRRAVLPRASLLAPR
jgi:hypothetical protein